MRKHLRLMGLVALVGIVLACGLFARDWIDVRTPNTIRSLVAHFGTTEGEIARVAAAYGVAMENIGDYGDAPFPGGFLWSYFGLDRPEAERAIFRRRDVETFVKGHMAECRESRLRTLYVFYSRRFAPKPLFSGESSYVLAFVYKLTPTTVNQDSAEDILAYVETADLNSESGWLASLDVREAAARTCAPPVTTR